MKTNFKFKNQLIAFAYVLLAVVAFGFTVQNYKILPCPICGADGYLHQAVNDIEHPAWTVDCTVYDKKGKGHKRVGKYWFHCKEDAVFVWNNYR